MLPGLVQNMIQPPVSGGVGVVWSGIIASGPLTVTGSNSDRAVPTTGTLNFSHAVFGSGFSYKVFKNGVDQGQVASLAVTAGDLVRFSASKASGAIGSVTEGPFFISGAVTSDFAIYLERAL